MATSVASGDETAQNAAVPHQELWLFCPVNTTTSALLRTIPENNNNANRVEALFHTFLSLALEELNNFNEVAQKLIHEQQLMREQMECLKDTITQQINLQNQLAIRLDGVASTVHEQHQQRLQHQHITIERSLSIRLEAIKRLPFLSGYPVTDCSLPFVVDDIEQKPTVVLLKNPLGPAVYFFANEAFCRQFKYSYVRGISLLSSLFLSVVLVCVCCTIIYVGISVGLTHISTLHYSLF